jgi:hypothetical protein
MKKRKNLSLYQARLAEAHHDRDDQYAADQLWVWLHRKPRGSKNVAEASVVSRGGKLLRVPVELPSDLPGNNHGSGGTAA